MYMHFHRVNTNDLAKYARGIHQGSFLFLTKYKSSDLVQPVHVN